MSYRKFNFPCVCVSESLLLKQVSAALGRKKKKEKQDRDFFSCLLSSFQYILLLLKARPLSYPGVKDCEDFPFAD